MKQKMTGCCGQQASTLHLSVARSGSTAHRGTRQSHVSSDPISLALMDVFDRFVFLAWENAKLLYRTVYVMIYSSRPEMNDTFVNLLIYIFAVLKSVNDLEIYKTIIFIVWRKGTSTAFQQHTQNQTPCLIHLTKTLSNWPQRDEYHLYIHCEQMTFHAEALSFTGNGTLHSHHMGGQEPKTQSQITHALFQPSHSSGI